MCVSVRKFIWVYVTVYSVYKCVRVYVFMELCVIVSDYVIVLVFVNVFMAVCDCVFECTWECVYVRVCECE